MNQVERVKYKKARQDRAILLRLEGFTYQKISEDLGLQSREVARGLVYGGARRWQKAMRRARFRYDDAPLFQEAAQ